MAKRKKEQQRKVIMISGGVVLLVLVVWLLVDDSLVTNLATRGRVKLDYGRVKEEVGFTTYQPFFKGTGTEYDIDRVDNLVKQVGDGELPDDLTADQLAEIKRVLEKSRSATFTQMADTDLVEAADRAWNELVAQCI